MKKKLVFSLLFVFTLAIAAPSMANAQEAEAAKTENCEKKKECDKEKKAACAEKTEKKAGCCSKAKN
jgi:Ni/Co efflux regulator RcnB